MKAFIHKTSLLIPALLVIVLPAMAQSAPPATPIDGGLSLLLLAGGAYGAKKLLSKKN
ncbi:MAG: hypothetical protein ACI8Q1_001658 [Parvicella sp.]|jgi:hypothetical protein